MNKSTIQFFKPAIILFLAVTIVCFVFSKQLDNHNIDHKGLLIANLILFVLVIITSALHIRALSNSNPYAFVRSITLGLFIKLMVIATAVVVYFHASNENANIYTVGLAMLLYVVYTVFEVAAAMRLNRKKNAKG